VRCSLKGRFKKDFQLKKSKLYAVDIAAVGDEVEFEMNQDGTGVISEVFERRNYLSRKAPKIKGASHRGERLEQIIAANIDNLFIINSTVEPKFNNRLLDRIIVAGESASLEIYLVINKMDLRSDDYILAWIDLYQELGYHVIPSSAVTNEGLDEIRNHLQGAKSLFWGQSGVGKSSLFNELFAHLNFRIGEISQWHMKGKHTTVTSIMEKIDENTFIIDTPGIREIDPYGIRKEDLGHYFREFTPFIENCKYSSCTHYHEPGCAVIEAVEQEKIPIERYESYLNILNTVEQDMNF